MLQPNTIYHIFNHANGDDNLFRSQENYQFFLNKMAYHLSPFVEIYAYCLMPNHFHLLLKIKPIDEVITYYQKAISAIGLHSNEKFELQLKLDKLLNLKMSADFQTSYSFYISKQFSNLFSSYTQAFNKFYKRKGSLFIKNFKRKEVDSISYFKKVLVYIHKNPKHHGFVSNFEEWNWHSFHEFESETSSYLNIDYTINYFGDLKSFKNAHNQIIYELDLVDLEI